MGGAQLVKILVQFLSVVVISRILSPEDFGLVASIMPIIVFVSTFQQIGLQQAIIQRPNIDDSQLNAIFWVLTALGIACFIVVVMLGPAAVWFYDDERLWKLVIVAGVPIIINNLNAIHLSLMTRHLRFKALAVIEILSAIGGFLATYVGALNGLGYWAIMLNPIAMAVISCIGTNVMTHWRPTQFTFRLDKDIFSFGANLTAFNLILFLGRNLDVLLIGRYAGAAALGYYDRAQRLLAFPLQNLNAPLTRIMLPILSRIQEDKQRLRSTYLRSVGLLTMASVPGIAAVTVTSHDVVLLLFGEKWMPVADIFFWIGISALNLPLNFTISWLYISQGQTKMLLRIGAAVSLIMGASFIIGIKWGAIGVAASYSICNYLLRAPIDLWGITKIGPVTYKDLLIVQVPFLIAAVITGFSSHYVLKVWLELHGIPLIALTGFISYAVALGIASMHVQGRQNLQEIMTLLQIGKKMIIERKK